MSSDSKVVEGIADFVSEYISKVEEIILRAEVGRNGDMVKLTEQELDEAQYVLKTIKDLCFHLGN